MVGSGRPPAWIARVRSPQTWSSIDVTRPKVASSCLASEALGPHPLGVVAATHLLRAGHDADLVRTERFGGAV